MKRKHQHKDSDGRCEVGPWNLHFWWDPQVIQIQRRFWESVLKNHFFAPEPKQFGDTEGGYVLLSISLGAIKTPRRSTPSAWSIASTSEHGLHMLPLKWSQIYSNTIVLGDQGYEEGAERSWQTTHNKKSPGVPLWLRRLKIWHCHCCGLGHGHGTGLIPGLGTSACCGHGQKFFKSYVFECSTQKHLYKIPVNSWELTSFLKFPPQIYNGHIHLLNAFSLPDKVLIFPSHDHLFFSKCLDLIVQDSRHWWKGYSSKNMILIPKSRQPRKFSIECLSLSTVLIWNSIFSISKFC